MYGTVSPNVTWGVGGGLNRLKKCHVLFEWPLSTKKQESGGGDKNNPVLRDAVYGRTLKQLVI